MIFRFKMRLIFAIFLIIIAFCKGDQGKVEAYYEDAKDILPNRTYYWKNWSFCQDVDNDLYYLYVWSEAAALRFLKNSCGLIRFVIDDKVWSMWYDEEPKEASNPEYQLMQITAMINSTTHTQPIFSQPGSTTLVVGNWFLNSHKEGEMTLQHSNKPLIITFLENLPGFIAENKLHMAANRITYSAKTLMGAEFSTSWIPRRETNQTEQQSNLISCCTLNRNQSDNGWTEIQCQNKARLHNISYAWNFDRFDLHRPAKGAEKIIRSPLFSSATYDKIKWYLKIYPRNNTSDQLSLYLCRCPNNTETQTWAYFSFDFLDSKGNLMHEVTSEWFITYSAGPDYMWGWNKIPINKVVSSDNSLNIVCKIAVCEFTTNTVHLNRTDTSINCGNNLGQNLVQSSTKNNSDNHEVTLVLSKTGKEYPANKSVLASSSPVFATMFNISCLGKGEKIDRVNITDVDSEQVMGELLKYIETSKCENIETLARDLLVAAHKFKLDNLTELCIEKITNNLTVENAVDTLILADKHGFDKLKSKTIRFIAVNYAQVSNTSDWKQMEKTKNNEFLHEVCKMMSNNLSNKEIAEV